MDEACVGYVIAAAGLEEEEKYEGHAFSVLHIIHYIILSMLRLRPFSTVVL